MKTTDTIAVTIECSTGIPPETSGFLGELLWTVDGVRGIEEVYEGPLGEERVAKIRVFADSPMIRERLDGLFAREEAFSVCRIDSESLIAAEDWAESWKRFWHVTHITDGIVIRPSWETYAPLEGETVINLDPGCAFGTGTHATTRLMLAEMERLATEKDFSRLAMLDLGCGSGILAVYAAMRGCRSVMALDIDPAAVEATAENARINGVADVVTASDTPLQEMCRTKYDVILANILGPVIIELLPEITVRLEAGGLLLASGLIEKSVGPVQDALEKAGFADIIRRQDGDWFLLRGVYTP